MMLALPLQGLAAAMMSNCGSAHHHIVQAEHDDHAQGHAHQHDAGDHASKNKCSACAACCVGAALLTTAAIAPAGRPSSEKIALVFSSRFGPVDEGLERPPRS